LQLAEQGVSTIAGDVITTWVEGAIEHRPSDWDSLKWITRATSVQFTSPTIPPSVDLFTTGVWRHRLTPVTVVIPSVQFESITYDNAANTTVMIWRGLIGAESQLTPRLRFKGNIGIAHVALTQDGTPTASNPAQLASGAAASWIGDVLLSYNLTKR